MDRELLDGPQKILVDQLSEYENEEALFADGFEEAFCGISYRHPLPPVATYDINRCIEILMRRDGMTYDEAWEYFGFNVQGAYLGEGTPCFVSFTDSYTTYEFSDEEIEKYDSAREELGS